MADVTNIFEERTMVEERTVLVNNITPPTGKITEGKIRDRLTIHFQKRSNGGGDVEKVLYPLQGYSKGAIIVFTRHIDREDLISRKHLVQLNDDCSMRICVQPIPKMFEAFKIVLNKFYVNLLPPEKIDKLKYQLKKTSNADLDTSSKTLTINVPNLLMLESVKNDIIYNISGIRDEGEINTAANSVPRGDQPPSRSPHFNENTITRELNKSWDAHNEAHGHRSALGGSQRSNADEVDKRCPICLDDFSKMKPSTHLNKCKHKFHQECLNTAMTHKPACPICGMMYGVMTGYQPRGKMIVSESTASGVSGYEGCGCITITYTFSSGTQGQNHPNPGRGYSGTSRTAYLPNNAEGKKVLGLLKKAFDAKLIFTIGTSVTSGNTDTITWNNIHHKTNQHGGASNFGYPDPTYLRRVTEELAAKGIE